MGEIVTIATTEERDAAAEAEKPLDLRELHERRAAIMAALDGEISRAAERLVALAPVETQRYVSNTWGSATEFAAAIIQHGCLDDKIKEPECFGFEDKDDAAAQMRALQEALRGVLTVEIDDHDWYVHVKFRPLSDAEVFYEQAFAFIRQGKCDEARDPAWKGLEAALRAETPGQEELSLVALKCRLCLVGRCEVPAADVDGRIHEIQQSMRGSSSE